MGTEAQSSAIPFMIYAAGVLVIVASMLIGSSLLGQRHMERATGEVFESGIEITGSAKLRLYPRFYLVAMFFVIFDLESVYLFAWSAAVPELGWMGYYEVLFFIAMLIAVLVYLWRVGGLNFGPVMRRVPLAKPKPAAVSTERSMAEQ
jgi:NADH-quinone oxidoreductase subunit A